MIRELREEIENLRLMLSKVSPVSGCGCSSCSLSRENVAAFVFYRCLIYRSVTIISENQEWEKMSFIILVFILKISKIMTCIKSIGQLLVDASMWNIFRNGLKTVLQLLLAAIITFSTIESCNGAKHCRRKEHHR